MDKIKKKDINENRDALMPAGICIIGAGRVGTTLAAAVSGLKNPLVKICAVSSPSLKSRERAAFLISGAAGTPPGEILYTPDNIKCASAGNVIMICTPDDVIKKVSAELASSATFNAKQKLFVHLSGAKSLNVLMPLKKAGGALASLHPLKSFASIENSIKTLKGSIFGVTYGRDLTRQQTSFIKTFIGILGCSAIEVADDKKSIYHASACIASNYLVSLLNYAVKTNEKIGIKPKDSIKGLVGLIDGTISNIKKLGTKKALTGPIARGDTGTIREHLESFKIFFESGQDQVYRVMGIETARLAFENGWINRSTFKEFEELFSSGEDKYKYEDI